MSDPGLESVFVDVLGEERGVVLLPKVGSRAATSQLQQGETTKAKASEKKEKKMSVVGRYVSHWAPIAAPAQHTGPAERLASVL